jgi:hypothetical protein
MRPIKQIVFRWFLSLSAAVGLGSHAAAPATVVQDAARGASGLRARHAQLAPQLAHNEFGRPVYLESQEGDNALRGEVYAVVDHSFEQVRALERADNWCQVLLLPFNTKQCISADDGIAVFVGRKKETPVADAFRVDFHYGVRSNSEDYLQVQLDARSGPLGTHDYRIGLEAAPLEGGRTFIHLSYSYAFGTMSRLAMQTYLATAGADKVGFSVEGREDSGAPRFVRGVRGVIERNTMRYYLAIEAFVDTLPAPPETRVEKTLREWFAATERFPRQLHEMELDDYLAMKRREYARLAQR